MSLEFALNAIGIVCKMKSMSSQTAQVLIWQTCKPSGRLPECWFGKLASTAISSAALRFRILEQAAGHLRWKVDYPPSQPVGSGFEPH